MSLCEANSQSSGDGSFEKAFCSKTQTDGLFITRGDGTIVISLETNGLPAATVEFLRRKLEQLSTVHRAEAHSVTVRGDL